MGWFVLPVVVRMFAERIIPSLPLLTDSITAILQLIRGVLSWISSTSPVFTCWLLVPLALYASLKVVRYTLFQWLWKCLIIFSLLLALPLTYDVFPKSGSRRSSSTPKWGKVTILLPCKRCDGHIGSGLLMSDDTYVKGRSFRSASI